MTARKISRQNTDDTQPNGAADPLSGRARHAPHPEPATDPTGGRPSLATPHAGAADPISSPRATVPQPEGAADPFDVPTSDATPSYRDVDPLAGLLMSETQDHSASKPIGSPTASEPHSRGAADAGSAIQDACPIAVRAEPAPFDLPTFVALWRQRQNLRRAEKRLGLQGQAICRGHVDGDLKAAAALWAKVQKGEGGAALSLVLAPYLSAIAVLVEHAKALEGELKRRVRAHPLWDGWAKDIRGMAEISLASLIGEAVHDITAYRSPSCLWKRFGLAVMEGGRQRLAAGEEGIRQGYNPNRRSTAWNIGASLMRSQKASDPYRAIYDNRKAYELARDIQKGHAHNRATRYMTKALLKEAWLAARRLSQEGQ